MNITIEENIPLSQILEAHGVAREIRGEPERLIETCQQLDWQNPARLWTFRAEIEPPADKLKAFMDRFEKIFHIHEAEGDYHSAWWIATDEGTDECVIKGLFADLNLSTGPGFSKRAADGPRIAIWFGRIHKMLSD